MSCGKLFENKSFWYARIEEFKRSGRRIENFVKDWISTGIDLEAENFINKEALHNPVLFNHRRYESYAVLKRTKIENYKSFDKSDFLEKAPNMESTGQLTELSADEAQKPEVMVNPLMTHVSASGKKRHILHFKGNSIMKSAGLRLITIKDVIAMIQSLKDEQGTFRVGDLKNAYLQIPLKNSSKRLCVVEVDGRFFQFNCLMWGITIAGDVLHRLVSLFMKPNAKSYAVFFK